MDAVSLLRAFRTEDAKELSDWCRMSLTEAIDGFNRALPLAIRGNPVAVRSYVSLWRSLADSLLRALHHQLPDVVAEVDGTVLVADVKDYATPISRFVLDAEAFEAPFSKFVEESTDPGLGIAVALVQKLRETIPGFRPVETEDSGLPHWEVSESELRAFRKNVAIALNVNEPPLERIRTSFDLSMTELGALFGVSRQAATQWIASGVPSDRREKVGTVASIAGLLEYHIRPGLVPDIVRRPADAYSGLSALEMIEQDRHAELLRSIRDSFDWARPA